MSVPKFKPDDILLLEQPFVKVPYESLRKTFRTQQKTIEREFNALQTAASQAGDTPDEAVKTIDGMIAKVEGLKRKLSELSEKSTVPTQSALKKRFQHLEKVEGMSGWDDPEWERYADTRVDRWIADWALRTGKGGTAMVVAQDKGIEDLVDIELFSDIGKIENALLGRSCTEALAWCSENKQTLRKNKSTLEFDLRLQEFIELSRNRKCEEAIAYSRKHLYPWMETHGPQIKQALALLAYPPTTAFGPYKRLYDAEKWKTLSRSFRHTAYDLSALPSQPLLNLALYAGLSALKHPSCYALQSPPQPQPTKASSTPPGTRSILPTSNTRESFPHSTYSSLSVHLESVAPPPPVTVPVPDSGVRNVDCPTCDPECLGVLAKEVPSSQHPNSTIVCRITGKIMDWNNPPLAFPNGQVYSTEALQEMADKNRGRVKCPRTGHTCGYVELKKVFIS